MRSVLEALCACLLPAAGGVAGAVCINRALTTDWYRRLRKPALRPPAWVFGPVWTALYTAMGYASYLVWRDGGGFAGPARLPLTLYGSQLVLNWMWGPIFFGARNIPWSLVDITLLWANVAACGWAFYGINAVAGYLFVPYFLWLTLATDLNYQIYKLNCTGKGSKD